MPSEEFEIKQAKLGKEIFGKIKEMMNDEPSRVNLGLDDDERKKFEDWDRDHKCKLKEDSGAIGGRLTYCFTPTGLGTITVIKCVCGEEINVTDFDSW